MTKLIFLKHSGYKYSTKEERETKKPVIYKGKELSEIDFTETTAQKNFCKITFKEPFTKGDDDKVYWTQDSFHFKEEDFKDFKKENQRGKK